MFFFRCKYWNYLLTEDDSLKKKCIYLFNLTIYYPVQVCLGV